VISLLEECLKAGTAVIFLKYARPMAVIAVFAGAELIIGKFLVMYWLSGTDSRIAFENHGTYITFVTSAAYCMHILTGVIYNRSMMMRALVICIIFHSTYNFLAGVSEKTPVPTNGIILFCAVFLLLIASLNFRIILRLIDDGDRDARRN
jgi:hypothetical protein